MQIFYVLDRYIGKTIFSTIITILFILVSLSVIIKFIDQLKKIGHGSYDVLGAWIYTLLSIPRDLQTFIPIAILLGVLLGLGTLTRFNELIVMQASGFSYMQIIFSVMKTIILLVLPAVIISEYIAPKLEQIAYNYRLHKIHDNHLLHYIPHGIWVKDGNNFVYIRYIRCNNELNDINIYILNKQHKLQLVRYITTAKFDISNKLWILSHINELNLTNLDQIRSSQIASEIWRTDLTPDKLNLITLKPGTLSIKDLSNYIKYLKYSGQNTKSQKLSIWNRIFQPLFMAVMALMATSFTLGPLNNVSMSTRIITGASFGFVFYVLNQTVSLLVLVYDISPIVGSLIPSIIFFIFSLWLLLKYS